MGRALKFYSSVRIEVRRIETLKSAGAAIGNHVRAKIVKNKVAPPFREAEFDIVFGKGISREGDILDTAVKYDFVNKAGAWYSYEGTRIGQGREKAKDYLLENPDVTEILYNKIMERIAKKEIDSKEEKEDIIEIE